MLSRLARPGALRMRIPLAMLLIPALLTILCRAQETPQPTPVTKSSAPQTAPEGTVAPQEHERMFGLVPTYSIVNGTYAAPLTPGGKFKLFVSDSTDPFVLFGTGLQGAIGQATNEFPSYGQGAAGYFKRFGAATADLTIGEFMGTFAFASLLHEDPRYFRVGSGPTGKRFGNALASAFVTRTDSGKKRFNWSNVLGRLAAGGISNLYYPSENRGVGLVFARAVIGIGYGAAGAVFSEFGPDIQRKLMKKKAKGQGQP